MKKIILKIKSFIKGPAPYKTKGFRSGFVILFAVTISAILLAIALGIANIALKEVRFSTNSRGTNDAFFAADTGIECALFNDTSGINAFRQSNGPDFIECNDMTIDLTTGSPSWNFVVTQLGNGQSCAKVNLTKTFSPNTTTIISKGYNNGGSISEVCDPGSNSIERQLEITYY